MRTAKRTGIAALFAVFFALLLAGCLCLGLPAKREAQAAEGAVSEEEITYNDSSINGISTPAELMAAYANVVSGQVTDTTITLAGNIQLDMVNDATITGAFPNGHLELPIGVTFDLNGNTLNVITGSGFCINIGQTVEGTDKTNATVTIQNGTLIGESGGNFAIVQEGSTLNLSDVDVQFTNAGGDGQTTRPAAVAVNGWSSDADAAILNVNNVMFSKLENAVPVFVGDPPSYQGTVNFTSDDPLTNLRDQINASSEYHKVETKLTGNIDGSLVVPEYANITIDLNGKTITNAAEQGQYATITNHGTLIIDGSNGGAVKATSAAKMSSSNDDDYTPYAVYNYGMLTAKNATITAEATASGTSTEDPDKPTASVYIRAYGIYNDAGSATLENCTVSASSASTSSYAVYNTKGALSIINGAFTAGKAELTTSGTPLYSLNSGSSVTVKGGTFTANGSSPYGIYVKSAQKAEIIGATVTSSKVGIYFYNIVETAKLSDSQVTVKAKTSKSYNVYVYGCGLEMDSVQLKTTASGTTAHGVYTGSLKSLTIKGNSSIETTSDNGSLVPLSINGTDAEVNLEQCSIPNGAIEVYGGATVNISGGQFGGVELDVRKGAFHITGGTFDSVPDLTMLADNYAIYKENGKYVVKTDDGNATLSKNNVAMIGDTGYNTLSDAIGAAQEGQTVTLLKSVEEDVTVSSGAVTLDLNGNTLTGNISVSGGSLSVVGSGKVTGTVGATDGTLQISGGSYANLIAADYLAEGYVLKASRNSDGVLTVEVVKGAPLASMMIGETEYKFIDLASALSAAPYDQSSEIVLLQDITLDADDTLTIYLENKEIKLDLGGKTIEATVEFDRGTSSFITVVNGAKLTICNGTIKRVAPANDGAVALIDVHSHNAGAPAKLTLKQDLTIEQSGNIAIFIYGYATLNTAAKIHVTGDGVIQSNGSENYAGKTVINITGGELTSDDDVAIFHPQNGELNISGGTVSGATAIYMRSGSLNVSGDAVIKATGAKNEGYPESGYTATGDAIVIRSSNYPGGAPVPSITGGTISSESASAVVSTAVEGAAAAENFISNGTFSEELPVEYLDEGIAQIEGADGNYTVGDYDSLAETADAVAVVKETGTAYTTLQDAIDAAGEGATVTLLKNITESVTIAEGKNITLDLNGQTLKNAAGSHTITNYGTLTITDSSGNGTVKATETKAMAVLNYGTALLASGTFTRSAETSGYVIKNYGYMTIGEDEKSSVIVSSENTDSSLVVSGYFDDADKEANNEGKITVTENKLTLVINGGTFTGGKIAIKNDDLGVMTIKNGTFKNNAEAVVQNSYQMTIENGTFTQENKSGRAIVATSEQYANVASTKITGGEFKSAGYVLANGVGNYPATETMEISGGSFTTTSTSASVVYVAKDGNLTVTGGSFVGESAKYGINFSGSKLSVSGENTSIKAKDGIYVSRAGAEVELSDVKVEATGNSLRFVRPKSVTISSGEYTGNVVITPDSDTTANITGGDFNGALEVNTVNAELTGFIEGGAFSEMPKMDYFAENYIAEYNAETGMYETKEGSWVAVIDEEGYATLQDAINAAKDGDTIILRADIGSAETPEMAEEIVVDKAGAEITLDLGGKSIYVTNGDNDVNTGLKFINLKAGTLSIINSEEGGGVISASGRAFQIVPEEKVEAKLVLREDVKVHAVGGPAVFIKPDGEANVSDGSACYAVLESAADLSTDSTYGAIQGNGTAHGTFITIDGGTLSSQGNVIYHPQYGKLVINGGTFESPVAGVEVRAGELIVNGGTFNIGGTFKCEYNNNGATIEGAAIAVSQHTTDLPLEFTIAGGTFNSDADGKAFYQAATISENTAPVTGEIKGGEFNGEVGAATLTGFIEGGDFGVKPADKLMNEGYAAEYVNGRYVAVPSTALQEARLAAQADVRAYAAAKGIDWSQIEAAAEDESAVKVLAAYNAIAEAMSTLAVAEAKLDAMAAVDDYAAAIGEAFAQLVAGAIAEIEKAAAASEDQTAVVVPTATYAAIYAAETEAELTYLKDNAIAEIEDIRAYRGEIAAQAKELKALKAAIAAIDGDLFGTEDAQGAIKDIQDAIAAAQEAITNGDETTSTSLKEIYDYLEGTLKGAVDGISRMLTDAVSEGGILHEMQTTLKALNATVNGDGAEGPALLDQLTAAIEAAQEAINGNTTEGLDGAVEKITAAITAAQEVIIAALPDYEETLGEIAGSVDKLEELLGGTNGLVAIKKGIDDALTAIGTADGETLFEQLAAIESGNTAIKTTVDELAAALTGTDGAIATLTAALTAMQGDITELTGALAEDTGWVAKDIAAAQAEIDKLTAAVGKLGTVDGKDLAAVVGEIADGLEEMDATVNSIASTVSAASAVEEAKTQAAADIRTWLEGYLEELAGDTAQADILARAAYTAETTEGELYKDISAQFGEENGKLVLKYYNEALAAIDAATTVSDVTTAVATFRAQVASIEASAGNSTDLTVVYVLLGVVLLVLIIACIVALVKGGRQPEPAPAQAKPAEAQPEEKAEEKEEQAEEAAPAEEPAGETAPAEEESAAAEDDDKERVVISANVRTFDEAYEDLTDEQRELFNKVKEYALAKEDAVEVKQSGGVVIKRKSKQIVKLTVRRDMPVALFLLENEMLKDFRRNAKSEAKLKVRATELVIREADDLETAYTMVDLSVEQIEKDLEAAKERRREARRQRRLQRQAEEAAAEQAEGAGEPAPAEEPASTESAATDGTDTE